MIIPEETCPDLHASRVCLVEGGEPSKINHEEYMAACESAWEDGRRIVIQDFRTDRGAHAPGSPR